MQRLKQILSQYPIFLVTLPLVFYVNTANYYFRLLNWNLLWVDMVIYFLAPIILYFLLALTLKSKWWAGALLLYFLLIFYFFHVLHQWLKDMPALSFLSSYSVILPVLLLVSIIYCIYIFKRKNGFPKLYYLGNLLFILLLAAGAIQYVYKAYTHAERAYFQADAKEDLRLSNINSCDTCSKPDIYFILLDGYTNSKTLNAEFNYSNQEITDFLKSKNFLVLSDSRSNYNFTHMSIASILNLGYLSKLDNSHSFYTKDFFESYYTVYNNHLTEWLKQQGYELNNYSIFEIKDAPSRITPFLQELNYRSVLGQTFFNKVYRDIGYHFSFLQPGQELTKEEKEKVNAGLKRIQETFDGVVNTSKTSSTAPRFTYAHFILPHETFYFDSTGKKLDPHYTARTMVNKQDYLQQLIYTNKFIVEPLVDSIFKNSNRPFVIIVQGDHGYRTYSPEKMNLEFENLSAIYFSNQQYNQLYPSMTSVNTFRVVLNTYLNQKLPLLKDSTINLSK